MEVILTKDIDKLGLAGQIVKIKDGFARNFLIPNRLAVPATAGNLKKLEQEKQKRILQLEKTKKEAEELKARLTDSSFTFPVLTQEDGSLYGSITPADVFQLLKEEGFEIEKNSIILEEPIRALGIYEIPVKLHPEVSAKIKVWVVKK